jgi:steroid 5-alpha reductase family enzyme
MLSDASNREALMVAFLIPWAQVGLAIFILMTLVWLLSLLLRNASIVDIIWGTGFVISAWLYFALTSEGYLVRKLILCTLVTIWGLRLSIHILRRNWGKPEDFRYQAWRREAGNRWWWRSYFKVFLLQGALMWLISSPLLAAQLSSVPNHVTILDGVGMLFWLIGFFFEAVGDWQLTRFKSKPENRGRLLSAGVWRYSRHPNYFGDAAQWWGYYLIAAATPNGPWTIFSPLLMTLLLLRVSGVTMLEATLKDTKPGYREYIETTSPFIPLPPRKRRKATFEEEK